MQIIETIPKLKPRAVDAHKGNFGKVLIIASSVGMSGAAALAGRAALRILYYQERNRPARICHWKKTRRTLRAMGIDLTKLRSCTPDDL